MVGARRRLAVAEDDSKGSSLGPENAPAHDDGTAAVLKPKVLLVWPVFQALYPRPFHNFANILVHAGRQTGYEFFNHVIERQSLVTAMNQVGEMMTKGDWDACLVFDDDCFPPHDVVPRLLARCFDEGHAFVAAAGVMRGFPYTTTAAKYYPEGITAILKPDQHLDHLAGFHWLDDLPDALTEVDFCGVPAAVIHKRVFEAIHPPWFGDADQDGQRVTHDVYFARKLQAAGFPVLVDGTLRCGHLTDPAIITVENRAQARQLVAS